MYIFQFTLPLTLNLIIMINTTPPLPTFFFLSPKKKAGLLQKTLLTHAFYFICMWRSHLWESVWTLRRSEWGGTWPCSPLSPCDPAWWPERTCTPQTGPRARHKQLQGHTQTTSRSHGNQGHTETTLQLQWCGVVKGQDTGSGVNKVETTAGVWQQSVFTCSATDSFQHTQNPHVHA